MTTLVQAKIIEIIRDGGRISAKSISDKLGISRQAVHRHLKKLLDHQNIQKLGNPPQVYYFLPEKEAKITDSRDNINPLDLNIIESEYLYITPLGKKLTGFAGFSAWCQRTHQPIGQTAHEYVKTLAKYQHFVRGGYISGHQKLTHTYPQVYLDELYYLDIYSIERFGKTKLGQLLLYAKQSQNKEIVRELIVTLVPRISHLVATHKISCLGLIPPTVKREIQLMKELDQALELRTPKLKLTKAKLDIPIPQKTLSKLEDRIINAAHTIVVDETIVYDNILLIDDAVASGATLNETARQIRQKGICKGKIIGLAIVGSFKGFDVISEV